MATRPAKSYTLPVLIHHQGQHNMRQVTAIPQLIQKGDIDKIASLAVNQSVPK